MAQQEKAIKEDNPSSAAVADAIDWSILDDLKSLQKPGKPDIRERLLKIFLTSSPKLFESAVTAVAESDGTALMRAAHSLKSSSFAIGAMVFGATCFELEKLGRANSPEKSTAILNRAGNEFMAVQSAIRDSLKGNESDIAPSLNQDKI